MRFFIISTLVLLATACTSNESSMRTDTIPTPQYPETHQDTIAEEYFDTIIPEPYRWLEDDMSEETKAWVNEQNAVTDSYLDQLSESDKIKSRLSELWNYARVSQPSKHGKFYYYYKNSGLQNQSVLYRSTDLEMTNEEVVLDPNQLSDDGTTSLAGVSYSNDGRYMAFQISEGGSDWRTIKIMDLASLSMFSDEVEKVKFSGASWYQNGFFYSRYPESAGSELSDQNQNHTVYYHRIGTNQSSDKAIYSNADAPLQNHYAYVTNDQRFLMVSASQGTSGNKLLIKNVRFGRNQNEFVEVVSDFKNDHSIIGNDRNTIFCMTNYKAPNYRLVKFELDDPNPDNWIDVLPENEQLVLTSVSMTGSKLFATYKEDVADKVLVYNLEGEFENEIELPAKGSVGGFGGEARRANETFFSFTSFTYPSVNYKYDIDSKEVTEVSKPNVDFDPENFITEQLFYPSKDGTMIPMYITYKKGIDKNGKLPVFLYGYGGFQISYDPAFVVHRLAFLEAGGVYVQANLRGGGEYGEKWHKDGMLDNKQNVFDDCIAAAEYLIKEGWTDKDHIAVHGRSNGGLLVGAVMTQRPDLFKVAIPSVGVLDMLRYHKFTIGHAWAVEYGSSDYEDQFKNLIKYSPLHNIRMDVDYPATLITTADHDDRVVPAHSFKFAATIQELSPNGLPKLIRIDKNAGHGAGKSTEMLIQEWTDIYAFTFHHLGMQMP